MSTCSSPSEEISGQNFSLSRVVSSRRTFGKTDQKRCLVFVQPRYEMGSQGRRVGGKFRKPWPNPRPREPFPTSAQAGRTQIDASRVFLDWPSTQSSDTTHHHFKIDQRSLAIGSPSDFPKAAFPIELPRACRRIVSVEPNRICRPFPGDAARLVQT